MDQPALEVRKLEKILDAFIRYEDWEAKKRKARDRARDRKTPVGV